MNSFIISYDQYLEMKEQADRAVVPGMLVQAREAIPNEVSSSWSRNPSADQQEYSAFKPVACGWLVRSRTGRQVPRGRI